MWAAKLKEKQLKGKTLTINGDKWTVVHVAPAPELAEMVAVFLEDQGFVVMTKGPDTVSDALTHLGVYHVGIAHVLVPEESADAADQLISEMLSGQDKEE